MYFTISTSRFIGRSMASRNLADYSAFSKLLESAKNIAILTGAGVSAESGIGTFRGASGIWRTHRAQDLATPQAFKSNPSLVWEFYHWRRETAFNATPNNAHVALAMFEEKCKRSGKNFTLITQNVDGLHERSGSENLIEMHGSLKKVICTKCGFIDINTDRPICEALKGRGDPTLEDDHAVIPMCDLPKCKKCQALIRPYIVWFGEALDERILSKCFSTVDSCDLFLLVGTSSVVHPAASFALSVANKGIPVAEFNIEEKPASRNFKFYFAGKCGITLPKALGIEL